MNPGTFLEAELNALPRIPPDAGPDWRGWIAYRDLLLRAKAMAENIKMKEAKL